MNRKMIIALIVLTLLCLPLDGCTISQVTAADENSESSDILYQVSTLNALMQGVYDGAITLDKLLEHGDFGIGTFESLDGEMVVLDGTVYQVSADGQINEVDGSIKTPFAMVTYFQTDIQSDVSDIPNYATLKDDISALLPSQNMFYAIKVTGTFSYVQTRSVAGQAEPYPLLADVTEDQAVFEANDVQGTMVGYWCPEYMDGVNLAGFHLHFLSDDHSKGGHLLECSIKEGSILIDTTTQFQMLLPDNDHFAQTSLNDVSQEEKQDAEE